MDTNIAECRVPDLLRITLQLTRPLSASPARLRRVRGGWRLSATPSPSGFDFRLLLVIIPGVVLILATILDFLETASRRVFLGTTELSCFMTCSDFIIVFLTHLYCEIHATNKIKGVVSILQQTQKINISLKGRLHCTSFRRAKVAILIVYLSWHIVSIVSFYIWAIYRYAFNDCKNHYIICLHAVYGYQNMMIVINQLQWSLIIAEVNSSLTAVNNRIKQLNQSKILNPSHLYSTLRSLGEYYETICDMVMQINKHTETFFFFLFMSKFHKLLTTLYNFMSTFGNIEQLIIQCNWCVYHLINILIIVEPCHWTQNQMDRTHGLLVPLSHQTGQGNNHISKELNLFLTQVQMRGPAFTPLGVFNISRPVIVVIFSIVATYLALLEQEQHDSELL
ncbi:uncharacterized protein isoform X3 [Choristoneura fumiferana]|uniref:uncharacterized protein isoform X3 n=1 Tax=Choristoneura fumiferana TaxID=7141 RepID=UPI003D154272